MVQRAKGSKYASLILVVVLLAALFLVKQCRHESPVDKPTTTTTTKPAEDPRGLNRTPTIINYSKHAKCRMACRHIDESEVKEILEKGKINYAKSELGNAPDCKKKYAVEGLTDDQQKVRIIFAPCQTEVTVVTVIDLGTDWSCDCE